MDTGFSRTEKPRVKRRRYSVEFKREAVRLVLIDGLGVSEVCEQLGVPVSVLYR